MWRKILNWREIIFPPQELFQNDLTILFKLCVHGCIRLKTIIEPEQLLMGDLKVY